ncbi:MAG: 4Fe-4S dicluster domain-containing protein [Streptosporangiaceae bacterium]|nr:4Fe-4S dicluster domain-containing protein [Streptosporangiaceae bacterium]
MSDEHDQLRSVIKDCVHCGFCLPACPTYQLWGEEMDSPRGRIYLANQVLDGAELTAAAAEHFDRCLGCMACMTACPSGVQYDQVIEAARVWTEEARSGEPVPGTGPRDAGPARGAEAEDGGLAGVDGAEGPSARAGGTTDRSISPKGGADVKRRLRDRAVRAAIFSVFPYPRRLRALTGPLRAAQRTGLDRRLARGTLPDRVSPALGAALRLAPPRPREAARGVLPERVAARGPRRAVVGMLTGCVQSVFFPQVNAATARVLAAEGCDVIIPRGQGCCGALSLHSGRAEEAARFARRTIAQFERAGVDAVVVNSAGCGSAMKEYERLLAGLPEPDPTFALAGQEESVSWVARAGALSGKVRDLAEFLAELGPAAPRHPLPVTAAYHDACHLAHAQRITRQPRELLSAIPSLRVVELPDAGMCCGSAGVYNLLQPGAARELGRRKADAVLATGARLVISANPGCTLQITAELGRRGESIAAVHTAEILDASIRGLPAGSLGVR